MMSPTPNGPPSFCMSGDPAFRSALFVVIDFEAATPAGRPAEPTEVAAVGLAWNGQSFAETHRFERLIRPPDGVAPTPHDVALCGITSVMLRDAEPAARVLADLDALIGGTPTRMTRLVAHSAPTEGNMLYRYAEACPRLARTRLIDTVRLSRVVWPHLESHSLDSVLRFLGVAAGADRHRALSDVLHTAMVLVAALSAGPADGVWRTLADVDTCAGLTPKAVVDDRVGEQGTLFA